MAPQLHFIPWAATAATALLGVLLQPAAVSAASTSSSATTTATTSSAASSSSSSSTFASALTSLCDGDDTAAALAISACSMRKYCQSAGSSDGTCSDVGLLAEACNYDSALPAVTALGVCDAVFATCPALDLAVANSSSSSSSSTATTASATATTTAACSSVPTMMSSYLVQSHIFSICDAMTMDGCSTCVQPTNKSTLATCNSLVVYGTLCSAMPSMTNCDDFSALCSSSSSVPLAMAPLCSATAAAASSSSTSSSSSSGTTYIAESNPVMLAYFHTGITDYVLFRAFVPRSAAQYFAALLLSFLLPVLTFSAAAARRAVVATRKDWAAANPILLANSSDSSTASQSATAVDVVDSKTDAALTPGNSARRARRAGLLGHLRSRDASFLPHHAIKTLLRTLEAIFSYLAMLIVMQFNVGLFFAVIVGVAVGAFLFDWDADEERDILCC